MSNPPTIHDTRALSWVYNETQNYIHTVVKGVNPHMSPKETISKLFPSAKVVVVAVGDKVVEGKEWTCNENGCDFETPILTLDTYSHKIDTNKEVVTKVCCKPVITCPYCLSQDVEINKQ